MHLLTFMKMCEPGWFMRLVLLGAQGVYVNVMFISYLFSPKICHRFVGYLEEEAVHTYTRCIKEIDEGYYPKWTDPKFEIPEIAVKYWNMPEGHRTMKDLILYIRVSGPAPGVAGSILRTWAATANGRESRRMRLATAA